MSYQVQASMHGDILAVVLEGTFEFNELGDLLDGMFADCAKHQALRVLVDLRGLSGDPSTLERFGTGTLFASKYMAARVAGRIPTCRFAFVGTPPLIEAKRFGETVAVNRGVPLRVFFDPTEARKWLLAESEEPLP